MIVAILYSLGWWRQSNVQPTNARNVTTEPIAEPELQSRDALGSKSQARCLDRSGGSLQYAPPKCCKIISAVVVLHNMAIQSHLPLPADESIAADENSEQEMGNNDHVDTARPGLEVRRAIVQSYFG